MVTLILILIYIYFFFILLPQPARAPHRRDMRRSRLHLLFLAVLLARSASIGKSPVAELL